MNWVKTFDKWLESAEKALMSLLFFALLGIATTQIVLRNGFDSGLSWGDDVIKVLVLWIGLAGAIYAARRGQHINIDVISRFLPPQGGLLVYRLVFLLTATLCAFAAYHSGLFIEIEREDGMIAFLTVPVWLTEVIIPISFAVIAFRYVLLGLGLVSPGSSDDVGSP